MSYERTLTLKKTGNGEWTIFAPKGHVLHVLNRCRDIKDAEEQARAWASSFSSVFIKVVDEQQDELRDQVPSKT